MKKKTRKIIGIAIILLIVIVVGISKGKEVYENSHVRFSDDNMGKVICETMRRKGIMPENITHKDLKRIKKLEMGFVGYYETIKDLKYCTELEDLAVNWGIGDYDPAFDINQGKADRELSKKEIEEVQKELAVILPKLSDLKTLWLSDFKGCKWTSLKFLKNCDQIEALYLWDCSVKEYSELKNCTSLKKLSLNESQISKAEDIIGLEHLEFIIFYDTPLAENPKEIKKLQEAYPNASLEWKFEE